MFGRTFVAMAFAVVGLPVGVEVEEVAPMRHLRPPMIQALRA